jgi:hypothetical protein
MQKDLDSALSLFPQELIKSLEALSRTTDMQERKLHSEIILNLSRSMGIFMDTGCDCDDDIDFEEFSLDEDEQE